ncbi:hypothetical protein [Candidatus Nitrosotenuis uzonensis]|uniref:Uncharacterized protein n=1 Tax=Candidatus Nitrosotenuis uzonensis TaxID=1407055 RepID=A0A812F310_9ARCH|nr:hypothetical protein [Candidatus Nitrosotenuis uzonensis]MCA2004066.1 hypothetical protein [Candidatus Nitrosotenuis sp.]CAE6499113.1 conserved exported hypothetical protein [Candidatus Nitrosotenuis uzonensis]
MNTKITLTSLTVAITIASIALVMSLSQTQQTTAEDAKKGNAAYLFGEGVNPKVTFVFREATVTYDFQLFTQSSNLFATAGGGVSQRTAIPEFTLTKLVGDTPYLHEAVDQTYYYQGRSTSHEYPYKFFDVIVNFDQAGKTLRTFKYTECSVTNYKITTEFDKAESFTGKDGFALTEAFSFQCNGFFPQNPTYQEMKNNGDMYSPYGRQ